MISVIVPIYNVEKYLDKCIRSLSEQTFKEQEIILVDDGSTDRSGAICDDWAKKDSRIVVIHQKNQGISEARNVGIGCSQGDYLAFVDGDDFVEAQYLEKLYRKAKEDDTDITICNYRFSDEDGNDIQNSNYSYFTSEKILNGYEVLMLFEDKHIRTFFDVCWNKLYKKELFEGIGFPKGISIVEDISLLPSLYYRAKRVGFCGEVLYNYVYRKSSVSNKSRSLSEDLAVRLPMMEKRLALYKEWNIKELCLLQVIHLYSLYLLEEKKNKDTLSKLQKEYRSLFLKKKYYGRIALSRKVKLIIAFLSLNIYNRLICLVER